VLAAGMATLADGTDGGGSIRIPASVNGVFGYKPPFGRNPLDREHPGEDLLHYGPLARSVADYALMQNVMSGKHPADLYSLGDKVVLPEKYESIAGARIALSIDLGYYEVDSEVRKNTLAAAETFRTLGCVVDEVELGWGWDVWDTWVATWEALSWALGGGLLTEWRDKMDPFLVKLMEKGSQHDVKKFYAMHKAKYDMHQKLLAATEGYDFLIAPTTAIPAPKADRKNDEPLIINGKSIAATHGGWWMTYPFNMLSQFPVMSVPTGFCSKTGVPTGLQIVGPTFDDLSVFRAASAFEAATQPWKTRRPAL
jgi:Asp-tRNA(Asn)/Glu-tRNA(Gln) amidotransferase A subunit family amidase